MVTASYNGHFIKIKMLLIVLTKGSDSFQAINALSELDEKGIISLVAAIGMILQSSRCLGWQLST